MTASRQPSPSAALQAANARLLSLRAEMARQRQQSAGLAAEPDLPTPHRHDPNIDTLNTLDSDTHNQEIPKLDFYKADAYRANIPDRSAPTALSTLPADTHSTAPGKVLYIAQSALKHSSTTSPLDSLIHHLPPHLGWYSASVTSQLRRRLPSDHTAPSYNALNRNARETAVSAEPALSLSKCSVQAVCKTIANGNVLMPLRNLSSICDALIPKGRETAVLPTFGIRDMLPLLRWSHLLGQPAGLPALYIWRSPSFFLWPHHTGQSVDLAIALETAVSQIFANSNASVPLDTLSSVWATPKQKGRETAVFQAFDIRDRPPLLRWSYLSGKPAGLPITLETAVSRTLGWAQTMETNVPSFLPTVPLPPLPKMSTSGGSAQAVLPSPDARTISSTETQQHARVQETVIKLHPSLALALLRSGQAATGRLWLLLRYLDENGRGWLELADVRARLTKKDSPARLCGQRQLRALLQQGNGNFWQRDKTRVWLFSTPKVAAGLGIRRLKGNPIALPLSVLLEPIGLVRAHLYASFHSSRMGRSGQSAAPISRVSLTAVSGVSRRSQHAYERRAGVVVRPNIVLGAPLNQQAAETVAWHHGRAAFVFTDKQGKQGKPGQQYLAWRLPNSYSGPHTRLGRGRQRQLNRQLVDLRHNGDAGNGRLAEVWRRRRYTADGVLAARCQKRAPEAWVYGYETSGRDATFWVVLSGGAGLG